LRPRRGFDRPPEEPKTRINESIRVPQVRLIDSDGSQIGIKARDEALEYAWAQDLDLVEVAPEARPPVCRVMDYSKYKYEQEQKAKLARKHQSTITIKEIKLRPKVGIHDYETKRGHVIRFLKNRDKVKVTIMFRGRETTHPERGRNLLLRLAEDVKDIAVIESEPLQDGRNMVMMLGPTRLATPVATGEDDATEPVDDVFEVPEVSDAPAEDEVSDAPAEDEVSEAPAAEEVAEAPAAEEVAEAPAAEETA
jgi:translation initiation factor IF-3